MLSAWLALPCWLVAVAPSQPQLQTWWWGWKRLSKKISPHLQVEQGVLSEHKERQLATACPQQLPLLLLPLRGVNATMLLACNSPHLSTVPPAFSMLVRPMGATSTPPRSCRAWRACCAWSVSSAA